MKMYARLFAVLLAAFSANAENLLTNASFNTPDADFNTDDAVAQWAGTGWDRWGAVFRQRWSAHSGHAGGYFRGWADGTAWAGSYQNVGSTGGVYTFTIWARREPSFTGLNNFQINLEWLDSTGINWVDTTGATYYNTFPADGLWHPLMVTATGTDSRIAYVRPVIMASWSSAGGSLAFDDAQLYHGTYTGATPRLLNPSFEYYTTNDIRGSQWACSGDPYNPFENPWDVFDWAQRTGTRGLAFKGWLTNFPNYEVVLSQVVTPGTTGVYTFAGFANREAGFLMTNAGMRIDVYDQTMTNLLQSAVTNFTIPGVTNIGTTNFIEYYVTLDITNASVWEVRPAFIAQWVTNTAPGNKALRLDDFSFYPGSYTPWTPKGLDYIYFNYTNAGMAQSEDVPGLGGVKFFDYRYGSNEESAVYMLSPAGAVAGMRARFYFANAGEIWANGAWYTNIVLDSAVTNFHGYPTAGVVTMEVWRTGFYPPANWQDNMWYSPAIRESVNGVEWWMAAQFDNPAISNGVTCTNNWPNDPQRFLNRIPNDSHDWYYYPTGRIDRAGVTLDWAYYNHTNWNPATEIIPSFDGTSTFLRVNYATTTTTFYVIAEKPLKELLPGENSYILMRTSWEVPPAGSGIWSNEWRAMSWVGNLVLNAATNFHGLPATGSHTVDLWRLDWPQPMTNGVLVTNAVTVYYAPLLKVVYGPLEYIEDERYLVKRIEGVTNGWGFNSYSPGPQYYGRVPTDDHDWLYINNPFSGLTDGIPDTWWALYGITGGDRVAADDYDGDHYSNLEEYAGNTDPTLDTSYFPRASTVDGVRTVMYLIVNPTSSERAYDAWWKTNLLDPSAWQPYGLSVPGNGSSITLTVTNEVNKRFYRTGAKLP